MPRFTVKDLLRATTLIAVGAGTLGYVFTFPRHFKAGDPTPWLLVLSVYGAFALIGAGLGTLVHRPLLGASLMLVFLFIFAALRITFHW